MVDWSNQREVVSFTRMVLQDLTRIEGALPVAVEDYYEATEVTDEPGVTLERFEELLEGLDSRDSPVRLVGDGLEEVELAHTEISRSIDMFEDQNINPIR